MKLTFEKRDDGFMAYDENGRGVCHVECFRVGETNDPNFRVQRKLLVPLPEPLIHFTSRRLTAEELGSIYDAVALGGHQEILDSFGSERP